VKKTELNESQRLERLEKLVYDLIQISNTQEEGMAVLGDSIRMLAGLPDKYKGQEVQGMKTKEKTSEDFMNEIIEETINPECSDRGRLDRLERQVQGIFDRLARLEARE
jgi:hypothetical protein